MHHPESQAEDDGDVSLAGVGRERMAFIPPPLVKGSRGSLVTIPNETHWCVILVNPFGHLMYVECFFKKMITLVLCNSLRERGGREGPGQRWLPFQVPVTAMAKVNQGLRAGEAEPEEVRRSQSR